MGSAEPGKGPPNRLPFSVYGKGTGHSLFWSGSHNTSRIGSNPQKLAEDSARQKTSIPLSCSFRGRGHSDADQRKPMPILPVQSSISEKESKLPQTVAEVHPKVPTLTQLTGEMLRSDFRKVEIPCSRLKKVSGRQGVEARSIIPERENCSEQAIENNNHPEITVPSGNSIQQRESNIGKAHNSSVSMSSDIQLNDQKPAPSRWCDDHGLKSFNKSSDRVDSDHVDLVCPVSRSPSCPDNINSQSQNPNPQTLSFSQPNDSPFPSRKPDKLQYSPAVLSLVKFLEMPKSLSDVDLQNSSSPCRLAEFRTKFAVETLIERMTTKRDEKVQQENGPRSRPERFIPPFFRTVEGRAAPIEDPKPGNEFEEQLFKPVRKRSKWKKVGSRKNELNSLKKRDFSEDDGMELLLKKPKARKEKETTRRKADEGSSGRAHSTKVQKVVHQRKKSTEIRKERDLCRKSEVRRKKVPAEELRDKRGPPRFNPHISFQRIVFVAKDVERLVVENNPIGFSIDFKKSEKTEEREGGMHPRHRPNRGKDKKKEVVSVKPVKTKKVKPKKPNPRLTPEEIMERRFQEELALVLDISAQEHFLSLKGQGEASETEHADGSDRLCEEDRFQKAHVERMLKEGKESADAFLNQKIDEIMGKE